MDNKYITENIENLFYNRVQKAEIDEKNKLKNNEISREKEETANKIKEFIGNIIYPVFCSFVKLLSSKNIKCGLSSAEEIWSKEKRIRHDEGILVENISQNFYDATNFKPRKRSRFETNIVGHSNFNRNTLEIPIISHLKVGDTIQYFKKGGSGYDVFEKTLEGRKTSGITITIKGGFYDGEINYKDNEGTQFTEGATYLPCMLKFSMINNDYPNNDYEIISLISDVAFDRGKHIENFLSHLTDASHFAASGHGLMGSHSYYRKGVADSRCLIQKK